MNVAVEVPPARPALRSAFAALPVLAKINLGLLALFVAVVTTLLWPHWRNEPDLSHGFLMLPLFFLLLRESRSGPQRFPAAGPATATAVAALLGLGLVAVVVSGFYAAALDWSHALVAFTLTGALVFLLAAGLVAFSTDRTRLVPLNWIALVAVGLWLLSAPIPPGSYTRLTIGLQLALTETVIRTLHLLGIAAVRHGNIIELGAATIGVEDACSGIRSLIACIYAGFFFSAMLVRRPRHRCVIIVLAPLLAVATNFARSLTLTLLANAGIDIAGGWHDLTGFAVLGITAALLGGLALVLDRHEPAARAAFPAPASPARFPFTQLLLAGGLAGVAALGVFFFSNTRPSVRANLPAPDLAAILPASVDGWRVDTARDLYQFSDTLQTDHLAQRTYLRQRPAGLEQITIYLAYWRAGQAPVSLVAMHTPDACAPGAGWIPVDNPPAHESLPLPSRTLPSAESRLFTKNGFPQYVWFWHLYDGRPIGHLDPRSAAALLKIAWHYGFTHDGDQLFVRVSSNLPWSDIAREPLLTDFFNRIRPLGL
jgi:exosortase